MVSTADPREQAVYGRDICGRAAGHLVHAVPEFSARWRIRPGPAAALSLIAAGFAVLWYYRPGLAAIVTSLTFGIVPLAVMRHPPAGLTPAGPLPPSLSDDELPVYTVLVPLFHETRVLDQLVAALSRLDYSALCSKRTNMGTTC